MRLLLAPDYKSLSREAAGIVADAIRRNPELTLGLPTGGTPLGMYGELVRLHRAEGLDFARTRTFNLDEYLGLPPNHPKSYHTYMRCHFFSHVNLPDANAWIPDGSPGVNVAEECERYESAIRDAGGIDLLVVGIGTNGHIAFNEPGSDFESRTRAVQLASQTIASAARHFSEEAAVPRQAITMGIATILEARRIVLLAHGARKAAAVKRALYGEIAVDSPASALRLHPDVTAILDSALVET
jgi:glucosamine-6-phosphate deaminase